MPGTDNDDQSPNLVLRGGTIVDPSGAFTGMNDIAVAGDRIIGIGRNLSADGSTVVVDCVGAILTPGLVDLHTHVYDGVLDVGIPADEAHLRRGVVLVNDGGSAGVSSFIGFRRYIVDTQQCRVVCFLNLSSVGIVNVHVSEFADPAAVLPQRAVAVARENPDVIRGVKVRLSRSEAGEDPLKFLRMALDVAQDAGLPVMAHVGATACTLAEILDQLRSGDIATHCFHGKGERLVQNGLVIPAALRARERGVLFDVGHGTTQMSYGVAREAIAAGFLPDTIGSDLSRRNWRKPAYDLPTVMSKMIALGMTLEQVVAAATANPASVLRLKEYGSVKVGGLACVTVLKAQEWEEVLPDAQNDQLKVRRLEPVAVVNRGVLVDPIPWRGEDSE